MPPARRREAWGKTRPTAPPPSLLRQRWLHAPRTARCRWKLRQLSKLVGGTTDRPSTHRRRQSKPIAPMTNSALAAGSAPRTLSLRRVACPMARLRHRAELVVEAPRIELGSCRPRSHSCFGRSLRSRWRPYTECALHCQALRQRNLEGRVRIELTLGSRLEGLQSSALPLSPPSLNLERGARPCAPAVPES